MTCPSALTDTPAGEPTTLTLVGSRAPPPKLTSLARTSSVTLCPATTEPVSSFATGGLAKRNTVIEVWFDTLPSVSATR